MCSGECQFCEDDYQCSECEIMESDMKEDEDRRLNNDSNIDVLDIVVVINIIIETYEPSDDESSVAEMKSDGVVDVLDIVILVNAILGD